MSLAKTESIAEIKARNKELINEVLQVYPEKTANGGPSISMCMNPASLTAASNPTSSRFPAL